MKGRERERVPERERAHKCERKREKRANIRLAGFDRGQTVTRERDGSAASVDRVDWVTRKSFKQQNLQQINKPT